MKPSMFIASSIENLSLAYAAQEGLEHDVEATVWTQGVFALSKSTMASLLDVVETSDFGLFVFAPSDVTEIKNIAKQTVRDNVIFELGLFVGRVGQDRCFMLVPRGIDDLHLPTDLLGVTTASYDPSRQDGNLVAALGPACNRMRNSIAKLGRIKVEPQARGSARESIDDPILTDPNDILAAIQSWMGKRPSSDNTAAIHYSRVDSALNLKSGSAKEHIERAAARWDYVVAVKGEHTILFRDRDSMF